MARGITFRSREEANEYSTRLREEGWQTVTAYDKGTNTWVVVKVARGELSVVGEEAEGETPLAEAEEKAVVMPKVKVKAKPKGVSGVIKRIGKGMKIEAREAIGLQPARRGRRPSEAVEITGERGEELGPTARRRLKLEKDLAALERGEVRGIDIEEIGRGRRRGIVSRTLKATKKPLETMRRHSVKAGMMRSIPTAVGLHPKIYPSKFEGREGEGTRRVEGIVPQHEIGKTAIQREIVGTTVQRGLVGTTGQHEIASTMGIPKIARSIGISREKGFQLDGVRLRTPYLKSSPNIEPMASERKEKRT